MFLTYYANLHSSLAHGVLKQWMKIIALLVTCFKKQRFYLEIQISDAFRNSRNSVYILQHSNWLKLGIAASFRSHVFPTSAIPY